MLNKGSNQANNNKKRTERAHGGGEEITPVAVRAPSNPTGTEKEKTSMLTDGL